MESALYETEQENGVLEEDFYSTNMIESYLEDDELSRGEEAFMIGYIAG